jgi:small conductance mechanosensitive channel
MVRFNPCGQNDASAGCRRAAVGRLGLLLLCWCLVWPAAKAAHAQQMPDGPAVPPARDAERPAETPRQVEVRPGVRDEEIENRLERILRATEWFEQPDVDVQDGVVFLRGRTSTREHREWATILAQNTRDVVAVVNRMEVVERPIWDLSPAWAELRSLWADAIQFTPFLAFGILIVLITWLLARWVARLARVGLRNRITNTLLRDVTAKALAVPILLLGLYVVLQVSGLTRLALTVLGGTGVAGLVIGIAFRDIIENYLASILISSNNPFQSGDLIEVDGNLGFVQRVTTRGTLLMTLEGNHVQIPNAIVYKHTIRNFTANPNLREDFVIGIGYEDAIAEAQQVALQVLRDHPAVLDDPEPMVLADNLAAATVNLRVYFWLNVSEHGPLKVRSSVIRLVKRTFQDYGFSLPDEAREVIFPEGVPIRRLGDHDELPPRQRAPQPKHEAAPAAEEQVTTSAEGGLRPEAGEIQAQAQKSRIPEPGDDLLATRRAAPE